MMKMTKFGPMMLLLHLTVTTRNISANPIASPGNMGGRVSPSDDGTTRDTNLIEQYMKYGTDILTLAMAWLNDNRIIPSQFNKSVEELENQIAKLPEALAMHRPKILEGLYKSQDRLVQLRRKLALVARNLKEDCETMIRIYDKYPASKALLIYTAKEFTKRAVLVEGILNAALTTSKEIQDQLSGTKGFLVHFNAKLNEKTNKIELEKKEARATQNDNSNIIITFAFTFTRGINCEITYKCIDTNKCNDTYILEAYIADLNKQLDDIKQSQKAATTLLGHVNTIKTYLAKEIDLIYDWKINLASSISDHKNFSVSALRFSIDAIKGNLMDLIDACNNYLSHEIPDILCTPFCLF